METGKERLKAWSEKQKKDPNFIGIGDLTLSAISTAKIVEDREYGIALEYASTPTEEELCSAVMNWVDAKERGDFQLIAVAHNPN